VTLKAMQKFAEKYCEISDTYFCSDLEITATVVKGASRGLDTCFGVPEERKSGGRVVSGVGKGTSFFLG